MRRLLLNIIPCIFTFFLGITYSIASLASESYEYLSEKTFSDIKAGQTIEFLLMREGEPDDIIRSLPDGKHFDSYYYHNINTSFIVNNETGYICGAAPGKHQGNCQPNINLTEQNSTGVYLGMPVNLALQKLTDYTAAIDSNIALPECYYLRSIQPNTGVEIMIFGGQVVRFDVTSTANLITKQGIGIGATTQNILALYPKAIKKPHPYLGDVGKYLIVKLPTGNSIVFETEFNIVTQFRLGRHPEVELIEGCS